MDKDKIKRDVEKAENTPKFETPEVFTLTAHINTLLAEVDRLEGKLVEALQQKCAAQMELKAFKNCSKPLFKDE